MPFRFAAFALLMCAFFCQADTQAENPKFNQLLETIWQAELKNRPTFASTQGDTRYNHRLADISPAGLQQADQQYRGFLQALAAFSEKNLNESEFISLQMQRYRLQNYVDQYRYKAHFMPITSEYGFHNSIAGLPRIVAFKTEKDYQDYLNRLVQIAAYFDQQISWMRQGLTTGIAQPKIVLEGFADTVSVYISEQVEESVFYSPFAKNTNDIQSWATLQNQAQQVIAEHVLPAYQRFYDFLVEEYVPKARAQIAAVNLPEGQAYYQNRIAYYTTTDLGADEIHKIGLDEVKRIRAQMQEVISELGFDGDLQAFIQFLRSDAQFYANDPEQLIEYASYLAKQADAKLPQLFYTLPRTPYGVEAVPASIAPKYTTGRYISPRRDDQPGYYWVNTYALDKRPLYALPALTLHEAVPGHHLQISLAREMSDLPPVRRFTYISAFGEGWGLYSEYLGKEVGFYKTPYDEFGRLSYEMWRACRLVVDTGMHSKGWSRQRAIDFMADNTALSKHNVVTEIDRYISWPAQALSYKLGELTIKRLRQKAEATLKDKFDLRAFHDALLANGSVPLSVLEQKIEQFIQMAN